MSIDRLEKMAQAFNTPVTSLLRESPVFKPRQFIKTGYKGLDDIVFKGGLPRSTSIELLGKSSEGKTTIALKIAESFIKQGLAVYWEDAENVLRFIDFENTFTGMDFPLVDAFDVETGEKIINPQTGKTIKIIDPNVFYVGESSSGEDFRKKLFTLLALDLYDLIIIDSMQALSPEIDIDADVEDPSQYEKFQTANFWNTLFKKFDNGFRAEQYNPSANKGKGGFVPIKNKIIRSQFVEDGTGKTKRIETNKIFKKGDFKAVVIFINHLKDKVSLSRFERHDIQTETGGGRRKEFAFDTRLILRARNIYAGTGKNKKYGGKDITVKNEKSRVTIPYGMTTLTLTPNGELFDSAGEVELNNKSNISESDKITNVISSITTKIQEADRDLPFLEKDE